MTKYEKKTDTIAGYNAADVAKAPLRPPTPDGSETKDDVKNPNVRFLVLSGAILLVVGIVVFVVSTPLLGFFIALLGGALTTYAVFAPMR